MAPTVDIDTVSADSLAMRSWHLRIMVVMTVLPIVAVIVRLVSRRMRLQKLWWDDWLCIMALFSNLGASVCIWLLRSHGLGYHAWEIDDNADAADDAHAHTHFPLFVQVSLAGGVAFAWNLAMTELSVLMLYHRLFQVAFQTSAVLRGALYGIAATVVCSAAVFMLLVIFHCVPLQKAWQPALPGYCTADAVGWVLSISLIIATDVLALLLPVREVWQMRLVTVEKVAILSNFALGWVVTLLSAYRMHLVFQYTHEDYSYTLTPIVGWSYIEITGRIVSACMPVSKPVFLAVLCPGRDASAGLPRSNRPLEQTRSWGR